MDHKLVFKTIFLATWIVCFQSTSTSAIPRKVADAHTLGAGQGKVSAVHDASSHVLQHKETHLHKQTQQKGALATGAKKQRVKRSIIVEVPVEVDSKDELDALASLMDSMESSNFDSSPSQVGDYPTYSNEVSTYDSSIPLLEPVIDDNDEIVESSPASYFESLVDTLPDQSDDSPEESLLGESSQPESFPRARRSKLLTSMSYNRFYRPNQFSRNHYYYGKRYYPFGKRMGPYYNSNDRLDYLLSQLKK